MLKDFEGRVKNEFDVDLQGQAHWYLQSRITQHSYYSITLDQSRYAASIGAKFLQTIPNEEITAKLKRTYASPLPLNITLSKKQLSDNYTVVRELEERYGFEYASAIGSLIYLMNTNTKINYAVRKLARYGIPWQRAFQSIEAFVVSCTIPLQ